MYMQFSFFMNTTVPFDVKNSALSWPRFWALTSANVFQLVPLDPAATKNTANEEKSHN